MPGLETSRESRSFGLSLAEVIISLFFLGFVSLIVLTMLETAFKAQRKNINILQAGLVAQTTMAQIRVWASNPANYLSNWAAYDGATLTSAEYPSYQVHVRCGYPGSGNPGCALYSPCKDLESEWVGTTRGARMMPSAVVPVMLNVTWSNNPNDHFVVVSLVGEPLRSPPYAGVATASSPATLPATGSVCDFSVTATDGGGLNLDNLLFSWSANPSYMTITKQRDGRICQVSRNAPPPPPARWFPNPPGNQWIRCWATYAGQSVVIQPVNVILP